jgi:hypothetical protein
VNGLHGLYRRHGLYGFKSWYADPLAPVRRVLVEADVPPAAITAAGIAFGGMAGAALALLRPGPVAGAAAGLPRVQGGPVGKTERCLLLALSWRSALLGRLS